MSRDNFARLGAFVVVVLGFVSSAVEVVERGHCMWYGQCSKGDTGQYLNCHYTGPAKKLSDPDGLKELRSVCPSLAKQDGDAVYTCCDKAQLKSLGLRMASLRLIVGSCSACYENLVDLFCAMSCHPNQAQFVTANDVKAPNGSVAGVAYALTRRYSEELYASCSAVPSPLSGDSKAVEMICGAMCSPTALLVGMGDRGNKQTPIQIDFSVTDTPVDVTPNVTLVPRDGALQSCACICSDCSQPCTQGQCTWYGECGVDARTGSLTPCPDANPARPVTSAVDNSALKRLCPALMPSDDSYKPETCCDGAELSVLSSVERQLSIDVYQCAACRRNLLAFLCSLLCRHDQSAFMTANEVTVTQRYADDVFASCRHIRRPIDSALLMSVFCGDGRNCTAVSLLQTAAQRLVRELRVRVGNAENGALDGVASRECEGSCFCCDVPCDDVEDDDIAGFDRAGFISICVFYAFVFIFVITLTIYYLVWRTRKRCGAAEKPVRSNCLERARLASNDFLERVMASWGRLCADHPFIVLVIGVLAAVALSIGLVKFEVTTNLTDLWSAKGSTARIEKDYFEEHFTPFYKVEQLIITAKNDSQWMRTKGGTSHLFGPVLRYEVLKEVQRLHRELQNLVVLSPETRDSVMLSDICYAPMAPDNNRCMQMNVLNYYQGDVTRWPDAGNGQRDYIDHLMYCTRHTLTTGCLAKSQIPTSPGGVLGGLPSAKNYENASALAINYIVKNTDDERFQKNAMAWEKAFVRLLGNYTSDIINVVYIASHSLEAELEDDAKSDIDIIAISYAVMFAYIIIVLGQYDSCRRLLISTKIILALSGVIIVVLSVLAAVGLFSYAGVPASLVVLEVVPFLVLAVGVDNIFIITQYRQRLENVHQLTVKEQIGRVLERVGPSMLLASLSEAVAFFLGALTPMPAVRMFSLYAGMAVLFNFLLQITCFVALLSLDIKREQANRSEVLCCAKLKAVDRSASGGILYNFMNRYYVHVVLHDWVRPIVVVLFVGWTCACAAMVNKLSVGLDRQLAIPKGSYVGDFYLAEFRYMTLSAPVYFVVPCGHNYTTALGQNRICGERSQCLDDALVSRINKAANQPNRTFIGSNATSWIDRYFTWLDWAESPRCCRESISHGDFCSSSFADGSQCKACEFSGDQPLGEDFMKHLVWFLQDNPGAYCLNGGRAQFGEAVELLENRTKIGATYFMTYHTVTQTSADYIGAMKAARSLADEINDKLYPNGNYNPTCPGHDPRINKVYPYSIFYVYYEQYLDIWSQTGINLGISTAAIFVISFLLLGFDIWSAINIIVTIAMITVNIFGLMYLWEIELNAISVVNVVMSIGISVEFCSHVTRSFAMSTEPSRVLRAKQALGEMGSSILSGITLTKLFGVVVLAFSNSQLFQVFYFRVYLGIVIFGAGHGLIFLPVFLSYLGPSVNKARLLKEVVDTDKNKPFNSVHPNKDKELSNNDKPFNSVYPNKGKEEIKTGERESESERVRERE